MVDWEEWALSLTSGDVVAIANRIRAHCERHETAEQAAREIVPHVINLLEGHGVMLRGEPNTLHPHCAYCSTPMRRDADNRLFFPCECNQ